MKRTVYFKKKDLLNVSICFNCFVFLKETCSIICRLILSVCFLFYAIRLFPYLFIKRLCACVYLSAFIICCIHFIFLFFVNLKQNGFRVCVCLYLHGCCVCFIKLFVGFFFCSIYLCVCLSLPPRKKNKQQRKKKEVFVFNAELIFLTIITS